MVVPDSLKNNILSVIHEGHCGINKTVSRAKELYYWQGMSADIEKFVKKCRTCEKYGRSEVQEPLQCHSIPEVPFLKLAADICTYGGKDYLVVKDYYSKWLEVIPLTRKTSEEMISIFKNLFCTFGIPEMIVADNMPFGSWALRNFARKWGFEIRNSSPHYPQSNGMAENGVKIAKGLLRKNTDLNLALLNYRTTPITGIGLSPAELLMNRKMRTRMPVVKQTLEPKLIDNKQVSEKMRNLQKISKSYYDRKSKEKRDFNTGENITVRKNKEWEQGQIIGKCKEPRSYLIKDENNRILRRNSNHLRPSLNNPVFKDTSTVPNGDREEKSMNEEGTSNNSSNRVTGKRTSKLPSKFKYSTI